MTSSGQHNRRAPAPGRRRPLLSTDAAVLGAGTVLALATAVIAASHPPGAPVAWRADLVLALSLTSALAVVAGLVWMLAVGTFTSGDLTYVRSAGRAQRADASRAIRDGQPVAPEQVALTSAIARTMVRQRATLPLWLGIIAGPLGLLVQPPGADPEVLLAVGLTVVGAAMTIPAFAGITRAQRWLAAAHHQR